MVGWWSSHQPKSSTHQRVEGLYTHYKDFRDWRWDDHPYIDPGLTQVIGFWQMSEVWRRLASKGFVTWSVWQKDAFERGIWRSFCFDRCFFLWHIELIVGMDTFALAMENMEWRWIWCGNRGWVIIVTLFHWHNVTLMVLDGCGKFGDGWTKMYYGWYGNNMAPKNGDGWFRWFPPSTGWFSGFILVFGGVSRII